jgi:uncharacterized protein YutE (UPF0331/DUF86 family)
MVDRDEIGTFLEILRMALGDLDRYRSSITREQLDQDRDVRLLIEYALLRALTATYDIARIWAPPPQSEWEGRSRYGEGFEEMVKAGLLTQDLSVRREINSWA